MFISGWFIDRNEQLQFLNVKVRLKIKGFMFYEEAEMLQ